MASIDEALSGSDTYVTVSADLHVSYIRVLSTSNSVVNLLVPKRHATLHINDLSNTLLLVSNVDGAAHLTNLTNCVVVLKCHQFRMHDSRNTQVYLSCMSRPIIEHCTDIAFAEYPSVIGEKVGIQIEEEEWALKGLVEDFNWLRKESSPNWTMLKEKISDDTWRRILDMLDTEKVDVSSILNLVVER